jgi:DNA helicase HerA-like ATPase
MADLQQEREVILVYGKTGMGKSRWTKRYLADKKRVIISDPMLEHEGQAFDDIAELIDHVEEYPTFRVKSEFSEEVPLLAAVAMAANEKRRFEGQKHPELVLAIEESQRSMPSGAQKLHPAIENVIYRGRHHRVTLLTVSQRPSTVHIAARSQWTRLVVFHQTEGSDIKWLEEQTGEPKELFHELKPGEYFEFTPVGGERKILPDQRAVSPIARQPEHASAGHHNRRGMRDERDGK